MTHISTAYTSFKTKVAGGNRATSMFLRIWSESALNQVDIEIDIDIVLPGHCERKGVDYFRLTIELAVFSSPAMSQDIFTFCSMAVISLQFTCNRTPKQTEDSIRLN